MNNCFYTPLAVRFSDRLAGLISKGTDNRLWDARQIRISGDSCSENIRDSVDCLGNIRRNRIKEKGSNPNQ